MDFGIFLPTGTRGDIISQTAPVFDPTYGQIRDLTVRAEELGFAFVLSMVKMRGFGGKTRFWDDCLDSFTLMSALAADTERIKLYASAPTLALHPFVAARMASTIDDVSGGRFGMNIVTGWIRQEYAQAGLWPGDHHYKTRYDHATEYVTILKQLWADGVSNFSGEYFSMDDCRLGPRPGHHIDLVCAGISDRGLQFTAEYGDIAFLNVGEGLDKLVEANRRLLDAGAQAGRTVGSYPSYLVVIGDSDAAAEARVRRYREGADYEAIAFMTGAASFDVATSNAARLRELQDAVFFGTPLIVGSPETVAAKCAEVAEVEGTAGMMLIFDDFAGGIERFGLEVMPLVASQPRGVASV